MTDLGMDGPEPELPAEGRPEIVLSTDEHEADRAAIKALGANTSVFARGSILVEVERDAVGGWQIAPINSGRCRELLTQSARFMRFKGSEMKPAHPAAWVVSAVMDQPAYPDMRELRAVVEAPILTANGVALVKEGYDEQSGVLLVPSTAYPHPRPTDKAGARAKADEILEVVGDFPFATQADRSAFLAAVLTPICQFAVSGDLPLIGFDANGPGVGKTLLASVTSILATGRPAAKMIYSGAGAEMRKAITGFALSGDRFALLDNVDRPLGGAALDAALTCGGVWQDRILGQNKVPRLPLRTVFAASGNGLSYRTDTTRRVLPVRLVSPLEAPEQRTGFQHPGLLAWLEKHRARLTSAALSLLLSYIEAGRPRVEMAPWGSYERWSRIVRGAIVWVGLPDPALSRQHLKRSDPEGDALAIVMEQWGDLAREIGEEIAPGCFACAAAHALEVVEDRNHRSYETYRPLREALRVLKPYGLTPRSLGMLLRHHADRVVDGRALGFKETRLGHRWFVNPVGRGTSGTSGTSELEGEK